MTTTISTDTSKTKKTARKFGAIGVAAATIVVSLTMTGFTGGAASANTNGNGAQAQAQSSGKGAPPTKSVGQAEDAKSRQTPNDKVMKEAKPLPSPENRGKGLGNGQGGPAGSTDAQEEAQGAPEKIEGVAPAVTPAASGSEVGLADSAAGGNDQSYSSNNTWQNSAWGGAYYTNPNLQVGKLYFDTQPGAGESWSWCSATAVNSENKSLIVTAGHCVYRPDPDGDGRITGNGFWYENFRFCPGYEYGCRLGVWYYRQVSTTWSWHGGVNGYYDFRDDTAVLLMSPNSNGYLVNYVGGHGISFNQPTNQYRNSFGYPASDWRWPSYSYSGEDLIHCPNNSYNDGTYVGTMWMNCTMTGGSSGGPWLSYVGSSWLGYVNSVNSHKPYGGRWMSGPYFDGPESSLFSYWRNR